ncbi:MAG: 16S rRNA (adenine(1518)-N(6)/adenine(1519)-N(6))-dimethyltransferase RsmA [Muribaculaceae bacterium]|nr:16S rRNA (adenine(1518)-N(6)/adenine(1519)-N(6))-dimethyltransferase RsmA [Muribaculaceae bacterium]
MQVKAKKQLGQHFLKDEDIARRIAGTISAVDLPEEARKWADIPILEIGPGMGVLTKYLMDTGRPLKAVELDSESVMFLSKVYPSLDVIEGDFLKMNLDEVYPSDFALIGNYPYNISSQIFFKVLDYKDRIPVVAGMLQKEVAERICSGPGSKAYGILSVLLQAWYDCRYLFDVEPFVFAPPPKVRSGVLLLTRNSRTDLGCDPVLFKNVVKQSFGMRRKTLRNSLASMIRPGSEAASLEVLSQRPERLSVEQFIDLTNAIAASR